MTAVPAMHPDLVHTLVADCGRGFTALCTIANPIVLAQLAAKVQATGLALFASNAIAVPVHAVETRGTWASVRCDPTRALPLRSHIIDAAVVAAGPSPAVCADLAHEVRRVLVPRGAVRVLCDGGADRARVAAYVDALQAAAIRVLRQETQGNAFVLVARGP